MAIKIPAIDGPSNLATLTIDEFKAMAFPRSSRFSIISMTKDWRAGISNALIHPRQVLKRIICQTSTDLVNTRNARIKACIMARICVMISTV